MHPVAPSEAVTGPTGLPAADLVVLGDTWTVDAARSWTTAVAVRGHRIVALGRAAAAGIGPATRVLEGGLVLPGFIDAHVHPSTAGRNQLTVDLTGLGGRSAYLAEVARYLATHPGSGWVTGGGWAMEHFPGGLPSAAELDGVTGDRPTLLFNRDVHGAWANSAALRRAGITAATPDPADGRIERDPVTGAPTGMLHEGAAYSFDADVVPPPGPAEWDDAILAGQRHLHRLGVTGWQDAWVTPATQQAYQRLAESGRLTARVVGALWWDRHRGPEQIADLVDRRGGGPTVGNAGSFHPGTVKIMVDGVLENRTGALLQPYCGCGGPGTTETSGLVYLSPGELTEAVTRLDALDFQVHLHAIGDRAVRMGLDAVAAARSVNGPRDNRHHLAHLQVVAPEDVPRFRELGVTATLQAYWAQHEPQMDELTVPGLGAERAAQQYPFGELHRSGAMLAMGSDWGVTTADPLAQLEVAVNRRDPAHRDGPVFLPGQRLPLPVAVAAFTAGSAAVNHDEAAGSLVVGARADLVVLDRNIFADPPRVADARVRWTVVNGQIVHEAADVGDRGSESAGDRDNSTR